MDHAQAQSQNAFDLLVVGAGPAGLMAAEQAARAGMRVAIAEAMPSPARKFLMAGKSGLNLTKAEEPNSFLQHFDTIAPLKPILAQFGPAEVIGFAQGLGQEVFTGSTGRVFPTRMKASPLLRAWLARLDALGVVLLRRHRWIGPLTTDAPHLLTTPKGQVAVTARALILALGGASWARLGSDGAWQTPVAAAGVPIVPIQASNVGLQRTWSDHMRPFFGQPVKNIELTVSDQRSRGEFVITQSGVEGGAIYALGRMLRQTPLARIDLAPQLSIHALRDMISNRKPKDSLSNFLRKSVKLDATKRALLFELTRPMPRDTDGLIASIKAAPLQVSGPRPIDEAISTAGGLSWDALTPELMLRDFPGVFCAGEMLDWDAPTGGYLITACLATGRWAGRAAADYLSAKALT
ncbi:TIGR03862 family flavoprotein [Planktomarina temperata]|uniref:NAD(P)/FAD-dependent oxidoreductase n=2 Tax=Planktomarina temperata TaxID=1284658 RepID=UPI00325FEE91|nr:TIGR03862 family flavoprotein [Planktomarina temperata]